MWEQGCSNRHRDRLFKKTKANPRINFIADGCSLFHPMPPFSPVVQSPSRIAQCLGLLGQRQGRQPASQACPWPSPSHPLPTLLHIKSCKHDYGHGPEQQRGRLMCKLIWDQEPDPVNQQPHLMLRPQVSLEKQGPGPKFWLRLCNSADGSAPLATHPFRFQVLRSNHPWAPLQA